MQTSRTGLTLVEWLVVIVCVSFLLFMLLPAVIETRDSRRVGVCGAKVKNLALAAMQHENTKGYLPCWVDKYGFFEGGRDRSDLAHAGGSVSAHVKVGGYAVALLPWLDAQPTYEHWTDDSYPVIHEGGVGAEFEPTASVGASNAGAGYHPLAVPNLPNFVCPDNPIVDAEHGRNSYIINAGMCYLRSPAAAARGGGVTAGLTTTQLDSQRVSNGTAKAGYMPLPTPEGFGIGPKVSLDDIKDGQTHTVLYSENVQALPWYLAGFLSGAGPAPNLLPTDPSLPEDLAWNDVNANGEFSKGQFTAGMVWHFEDPQAAKLNAMTPPVTSPSGLEVATDQFKMHRINGGGIDVSQDLFTLQMNRSNCMDLARPSSAHVDGVYMGFADGASRYISDEIDYRVYQALLTPDGSESDVPLPSYVLDSDDLVD